MSPATTIEQALQDLDLDMRWYPHHTLLLLAGTGSALLLAFPWLMSNLPELGTAIALFFSQLCHQDSNRSFALAGVPLPVCARCLALYLGGFVGIAACPLLRFIPTSRRRITRLLVIALGLLVLDAGLDMAGLWNNTPVTRSLTGALFGGVCGLILSLAVQQSSGSSSSEQPLRTAANQTIHPS
jgi:uncharacterized membrane protein